MNIYQRLTEAKKKIGYVQKDKDVSTGGSGKYKAVTHDAVTAFTRGVLVEVGIVVIPTELSSSVEAAGVTSNGTPIIRFQAKYRVDFINTDQPDDRVSIELTSHALDSGDKSPGKALSYATKYALLKVLQLETGEDEESRLTPDKVVDIDKWSVKIRQTKSLDDLTALWKEIAAECNGLKDMQAYGNLKNECTLQTKKIEKGA